MVVLDECLDRAANAGVQEMIDDEGGLGLGLRGLPEALAAQLKVEPSLQLAIDVQMNRRTLRLTGKTPGCASAKSKARGARCSASSILASTRPPRRRSCAWHSDAPRGRRQVAHRSVGGGERGAGGRARVLARARESPSHAREHGAAAARRTRLRAARPQRAGAGHERDGGPAGDAQRARPEP